MSKGNLINNMDRTPSERRESAQKAGKASGVARRKKKALKDLLKMALEMPSSNGNTNAEEIVTGLINAAMAGDVKAFVAIRDTIGEKPVDKLEVGMADNLVEDVAGVKDV